MNFLKTYEEEVFYSQVKDFILSNKINQIFNNNKIILFSLYLDKIWLN